MSRTGFSAPEIVSIISALSASKVSKFKYKELEMEISQAPSWGTEQPSQSDPGTPPAEIHPITPVGNEQGPISEEDRLEHIKLEDPEEYERLLELKEVADGDTNN